MSPAGSTDRHRDHEDGFRRLTDDESSEIARSILERRLQQPDGPRAALL